MAEHSYSYQVYGLNVKSTIPIPELVLGEGIPDVTIQNGSVPDRLHNAVSIGGFYEATPGSFLFSVDGVARYLVTDGDRILIQPERDAVDDEIRLFLLGCAFAALLQQRGQFPLHCSAIVVDGGCIGFAGHSGAGKSTLAAGFLKRGYSILADDLCVVALNADGMPYAYPGYPQLKLWPDTMGKLGEECQSLARIRPQLDKFRRPIGPDFCRIPLPLLRLYVLGISESRDVELRQVKGSEKIAAIIENTYHLAFLDGLGKLPEHFRQCQRLAERLTVVKVNRPGEPFLLEGLIEALEGDFSDTRHC